MADDGDKYIFDESEPPFGLEPSISTTRKKVAAWLDCEYFHYVLGLLIGVQICLSVYETDLGANGSVEPAWLNVSRWAFVAIYSFELSARLYVFRFGFFCEAANVFDFFIVAVDVFFVAFEPLIGPFPSSSVLRIFRIGRVLRVVRVMKNFRELYAMLHGFVSAIKGIVWATVLIFIVLLFYGILAVELLHPINKQVAASGRYEDCDRCGRAFESVFQSVLTFVQQIIAGDSWGVVTLPIIEQEPWTVVLFIAVLVSIDMGLMNFVMTVIIDQGNAARENDLAERAKEKVKSMKKAKAKLLHLCKEMDEDMTGSLTVDELMHGYDNNEVFCNTIKVMDASREDLPTIFEILDSDRSGDVDYNEFVEQLYRIKQQDAHTMLCFVKCYLSDLREEVRQCSTDITSIRSEVMEQSGAFTDQMKRLGVRVDAAVARSLQMSAQGEDTDLARDFSGAAGAVSVSAVPALLAALPAPLVPVARAPLAAQVALPPAARSQWTVLDEPVHDGLVRFEEPAPSFVCTKGVCGALRDDLASSRTPAQKMCSSIGTEQGDADQASTAVAAGAPAGFAAELRRVRSELGRVQRNIDAEASKAIESKTAILKDLQRHCAELSALEQLGDTTRIPIVQSLSPYGSTSGA
eukprot:TRINITY_DN9470_c0_g1_i1.p1 TRINITY_DN9470_c0_g1~~TRINITY_DN9470_c0_g1_i1.p1  ORF type:complete len:635 (-),score=110.76 TRINITY_DN9470_c0_g1_i1:237-2141(-)